MCCTPNFSDFYDASNVSHETHLFTSRPMEIGDYLPNARACFDRWQNTHCVKRHLLGSVLLRVADYLPLFSYSNMLESKAAWHICSPFSNVCTPACSYVCAIQIDLILCWG